MLKDKKKTEEEEEYAKDFNQFFSGVFKESEPLLRLYRVERKGVKYVKEYLHTYDFIPTEEKVGYDFGGGRFWICGEDPEAENMVSRYINIHHSFTERLEKRLKGKEQVKVPVSTAAPPPPDPFAGVEKLIMLLTPLVKLFMDSRPAATNNTMQPNLKPLMEGLVSSFTSGFKQMGRSMVENQKELLESRGEEPTTKNELSGVGQELMGIVKTFGEAFINSKGFMKNKMKKEILSNEELQNLSSEDMGAIYDACKADPEIGETKISKIFEELGLVVQPGDEPANNGKPEKEEVKQTA